jgi:hypothetical protein
VRFPAACEVLRVPPCFAVPPPPQSEVGSDLSAASDTDLYVSRSDRIEELVNEADAIEERLRAWQESEPAPDAVELREGAREYQAWYARALRVVPDEHSDEFRDMYEGGSFVTRIRGFLADPLALNDFYDPALADNPFAPGRFRHSFESTFRDNLTRQRAVLVMSLESQAGPVALIDELTDLFPRLPDFLHILEAAGNANVPVPTLTNEADLQVLVHAILRMHFDDVRAEDYVSQQAGGRSRVDFLLRQSGVIVETKMTRPTLTDKRVGEELLVDWGRYQRHPDCRAIFALVYDPGRYIVNPAGLTEDLSQVEREPATRAIVVR